MGEERGREKGEHRERERKRKKSRRERKDGAELWYVVPSFHLKLIFYRGGVFETVQCMMCKSTLDLSCSHFSFADHHHFTDV